MALVSAVRIAWNAPLHNVSRALVGCQVLPWRAAPAGLPSEFHVKRHRLHLPATAPARGFGSRGKKQAQGPTVVMNEHIKVPSLRVVAADGTQLGVMDTSAALALAQERKQDLILVAPAAKPPVAKLDSAARQAQAVKKKEAAARKQARTNKLKEVRLTARTESHDLHTKTRQLLKFLGQGRPVRVTVAFQPGSSYAVQEPQRRAVLREMVTLVGTGGWADPSSLKVQGVFLFADFKPLTKTAEEHEVILGMLERPLKNQEAVAGAAPKKAPAPTPDAPPSSDVSLEQYMAGKARGKTKPPSAPRDAPRGGRKGMPRDDLDRLGSPLKEVK